MRDPATVTESGDGAGLEGPIFPLIAEDHVFSHGDSPRRFQESSTVPHS